MYANADLARFHLVHPTRDRRPRQDERVLLQPLDVAAHRAFGVSELVEVDGVDRDRARAGLLDDVTQLRRVEGHHTAVGVMEDRDLARAEEALRDDDTAKCVFAKRPT